MQPQKCHLSSALPLKFNLAPANLVRGADITISFMSITAFHILYLSCMKDKEQNQLPPTATPDQCNAHFYSCFYFSSILYHKINTLICSSFTDEKKEVNIDTLIWLNYHKSWTKSKHLHFDCMKHWTKACTVLCQYYNPKYSSTSA